MNAWISDPVGGLYYDPYEMTSGDSIIRNHRVRSPSQVDSALAHISIYTLEPLSGDHASNQLNC